MEGWSAWVRWEQAVALHGLCVLQSLAACAGTPARRPGTQVGWECRMLSFGRTVEGVQPGRTEHRAEQNRAEHRWEQAVAHAVMHSYVCCCSPLPLAHSPFCISPVHPLPGGTWEPSLLIANQPTNFPVPGVIMGYIHLARLIPQCNSPTTTNWPTNQPTNHLTNQPTASPGSHAAL